MDFIMCSCRYIYQIHVPNKHSFDQSLNCRYFFSWAAEIDWFRQLFAMIAELALK